MKEPAVIEIIALLACVLCACGSVEPTGETASKVSLVERIPDNDPTRQEYLAQLEEDSSKTAALLDRDATDINTSDSVSTATLYEQFLNDEVPVLVRLDKIQNYDSYIEIDLNDGAEYMLSELIAAVSRDEDDKTISYAYMDCGNDGDPELALRAEAVEQYFSWWEYWVIKNRGGRLECIYAREAWPRSDITLNQYGLICGHGASGAAYHSNDERYLDATGNVLYIFSRDIIGFSVSPDGYGTLLEYNVLPPDAVVLDENADITEYMEDDDSYEEEQRPFLFYQYDFDNTLDNHMNDACSYEEQDLTATEGNEDDVHFGYLLTEQDQSIFDDAYPLKTQLVNAGFQIYRPAEINEMVHMQEQYYGITQEILDAPELEWTILKTQ